MFDPEPESAIQSLKKLAAEKDAKRDVEQRHAKAFPPEAYNFKRDNKTAQAGTEIGGALRSARRPPLWIALEGMKPLLEAVTGRMQLGLEHGYGRRTWQTGNEEWLVDAISHMLDHLCDWLAGDGSEDHLGAVGFGIMAICWYRAKRPKVFHRAMLMHFTERELGNLSAYGLLGKIQQAALGNDTYEKMLAKAAQEPVPEP